MRQGGLLLFGCYLVASAVPIVALGVGLTDLYQEQLDEHGLQEAVVRADAVANAALEPALAGRDPSAGVTPSERWALVNATESLLRSGNVLRLRLRSRSGVVLFDAAHPQESRHGRPDEEAEEAARGHPVRKLTRINADQVDARKRIGARAVEVYLPVHSVDPRRQVIAVEEVYLPYAPIEHSLAVSRRRMTKLIVAGLAAVWTVLGAMTWMVTRRLRRSAAANEHLALHDSLTGLPNRSLFGDRAQHAIAAARRSGNPVGIAVVDLNRFKEVNDTLGHHNGDVYLCHVATQLRGVLRPGDTIARLGGDEFGLVLPGLDRRSARTVLERVQEALTVEVELNGIPVSVEASIGIAAWPLDASEWAELLQCADLAMYAAKETRAGIIEYGEELEHFNPTRLALVGQLRRAIAADELVLHYQPKLDLRDRSIRGVEALVRWQHPTRGLLPPSEFLDVAETTGLIGPLTDWVVHRAVRQIAEWSTAGAPLAVAVNVSARNLRDDTLPDMIFTCLAEHGVDPASLEVEITETAIIADPIRAAEVLRRLHDGGVRVSVDDFGQGYTSLAHLGRLPLSELKIDGSFVAAMPDSSEDRTIVRTVIELGHHLGLTVVAEGVELEGVLETLDAMGCDAVQGFLLTRPLDPANLQHWLRAYERSRPTAVGNA